MNPFSALIRLYCRHMPISRGKTRLIEKYYELFKPEGLFLERTGFGALMELDISQYVERKIYFEGVYEGRVLELMKAVNKAVPCNVMLDVGANVGQHSLFAALVMGVPRIYAFEPCENSYRKLLKNISLNALNGRVEPRMKAVADEAEKEFFVSAPFVSNQGGNYISKTRTEYSVNKVNAVTLDSFFSDLKDEKLLLKIDVEGAEHAVLRGGEALLKARRFTAIFTEICPEFLKRFGKRPIEVIRLLETAGYVGYRIQRRSLKRIKAYDDFPAFSEALFLPKERVDQIGEIVK